MLQHSSPILAAAASPAYLAKGCVNIIELGSFKEQAGARWSRICEGVYARLESLLRAKLGPNDIFVRVGDIAYLVTMPTTDPEDVSAVCMRVAFDLHTSFLGQCGIGQIEVNTVSAGAGDTLVFQRLSVEKVASLAEKAGISFGADGQGAAVSSDIQPRAQTASIAPLAKNSSTSWSSVEPPPPALTLEHHFVPVWSVRNAAVTSYVCEPKTIFAAGRRDSIPISQLTPKERIQVDLAAFQVGTVQLATSHAADTRFLLMAPVSFELLGTPTGRMELLAACRNLSYNFRNFLSFVICDVPPGVAQSRLASMVTILQPFGRGVSATIAPKQRVFGSYQGIGLQAIGFDLRAFSPQAPLTQTELEQMAQFARRSNLGTFLWNVQDRAILKYAQDAHIAQLSGPAVAAAMTQPEGMWRLTWADVLARPEIEIWG